MVKRPKTSEGRNLTADLAICETATAGPWWAEDGEDTWQLFGGPYGARQLLKAPKHGTDYAEYWPEPSDAHFIVEARTGWPHAIERAMAAEKEVDRLRTLIREAVDEHKRISGKTDVLAKEEDIVKQTVATEATETYNGFTYITVRENDIESTAVCSGCKEPINLARAYTQREVIDERTFKFYSVHKYCRAKGVTADVETEL